MKWHRPDFPLLFVVLCLVCFELVMVYSASMVWAVQVVGAAPNYFFIHQSISALLGFMLMMVLANVSYEKWMDWAKRVTMVTLVGLMAVFIPGIGRKAAGL